jgi:heptosyltransferase-3
MEGPEARMDFRGVNKILVIKLRQIGDVLLSVPVFRALRETFPQAHITALVNSGTEEVLTGNPLIDEVMIFDRHVKNLHPWQRGVKEWSFMQRIRREGFDLAVDLTSGDRAALVSFLSGARYRLAYDLREGGLWGKRHLYTHLAKKQEDQHIVLYNLGVVSHFGINTNNLGVEFVIPEEARRFVQRIFLENQVSERDTVIHVHPTSRWLFKCWKDEYMAEVIAWLITQGKKVIVTSSPDRKELDKAKRILSLLPAGISKANLIDLCGRTTLKQLGAVAAAADLFLGVDSAPMHIAAAVSTPVVALFGPSRVHRWAPWPKGIFSLRTKEDFSRQYKNDCYLLGDHVVVQKRWECFPCGKDGCNGSKKSKCLEDIKVAEVKELLLERMPLKKLVGPAQPAFIRKR